jgi:2-dehydro-3-deoxyphosphogluconate aldolase / (4S)-4-hydroxy-2-oxoglutarate aldolase
MTNPAEPTDRPDPLAVLTEDRALCVVRAARIPDPAGLAAALAGAGIRAVEFTFTTPDVLSVIEAAGASGAALIGAGTVLTAAQARDAISAGARFLVTPSLRPEVARAARAAGIPVIMGALTPTEVAQAVDLGATAVKIFPARLGGPAYLRDLRGPFPDLRLIPSGGVNTGNARAFLDAGAVAVSAGTDVVPPELVERAEHALIAERAAAFARCLDQS